ncbi:type III effector HrpK domain-containing protein [Dickeya fangzhongdai]|uniref:type III effector HrpK domain-containing protein n=1 Tax=Dickeya fangzhongdai TaxID=1778540 RepID=UPI0004F92068|nr:type III effector HrpK domain-containing protein [Dickeya fangzhongdai]AIR67858.1 type III effector HrpK [Dickeya fangzhongdai]KGT96207.1 type III effector HrpK [Dickeya fangzhongdai]
MSRIDNRVGLWPGAGPAAQPLTTPDHRPPQLPATSGQAVEFGGPAPSFATGPAAPVTAAGRARVAPPATTLAAEQATAMLDRSHYSDAKALEKWMPLLGSLPEQERESAAKALNRPIAAAHMLKAGGAEAEVAMIYLRANPALMTALDTGKDGGKADGYISRRDSGAFIKNMTRSAQSAQRSLDDYRQAHPQADARSLRLVDTSALLLANEPLLRAADPSHSAANAAPQSVSPLSRQTDLAALANGNPLLSPELQNAARLWSHPGLFSLLEHADVKGEKLARVPHDGKLSAGDIRSWIADQAPADDEQTTALFHDAAALGLAGRTDISRLNDDVFAHPDRYSGAQKAATLVKLQQTLEQVAAGRQYRKTDETERALNERIGQLQQDADVVRHFEQAVPADALRLQMSDPQLARLARPGDSGLLTPTTTGLGANSVAQSAADRRAPGDAQLTGQMGRHLMDAAKSSLHITDLSKTAGSKTAIGLAGRVGAAVAGKVVGAVAGEAAGAAAASAVGAAAGPVGWAVSGALSIGMGIAELVNFFKAKSKLKHRRADFANTVNPTLTQFNIPKPR